MINLSDLSEKTVHPAKKILAPYSKLKVSAAMGISPSYLINILNGSTRPSKELNDKINRFAADVVAAEKNN